MIVGLDIAQYHFWSFFWSLDLYIVVEKLLMGGGGWVHLDYSVSSGPFLTMNFEFDQDPSLTIL